jgi:nucleotide-binding universal stress UspA family protein
MKLLERILVAVDLGPQSDDVLVTASALATKFGSSVVLLHVLPRVGAQSPSEERDVCLARQATTERLHQFGTRLVDEQVPVEEVVVDGIAFDQIISQAVMLDVNVIVLGSGASAGGSQLGITAERVCRKSPKPVWVVSPGVSSVPRSILCPVDFSKPSERALRNAIHVARSYAAGLIVLGSVGSTGLSRILLGSVTSHVIRQLPCSMVTVKAEDAFQLRVSEQVGDFDLHFRQATQLLEQGLPREAERQFQCCVMINAMFPPAWEGLGECCRRLHDNTRAEEYLKTARQAKNCLAWRAVEADIRRHHPFWKQS